MAKIQVNGTTLEVEEQGSGDPVVFVHGAFSDRRAWQSQVGAFASKYRVISYSRRYHHPNSPIPDGVEDRVEEHAQDVLGILDALGIQKAHIVGISHGGVIALYFARENISRVRSLVLVEPALLTLLASHQPKPPEILKLLFTHPKAGLNFVKFGAKGVGPAMKEFSQGNFEDGGVAFMRQGITEIGFSRLNKDRIEQIRVNAKPHAAFLMGKGAGPFPRSDFKKLDVPAVLVYGANTMPVMNLMVDIMADELPNVQKACVADAIHLVNEDNPAGFNKAVMDFIASV